MMNYKSHVITALAPLLLGAGYVSSAFAQGMPDKLVNGKYHPNHNIADLAIGIGSAPDAKLLEKADSHEVLVQEYRWAVAALDRIGKEQVNATQKLVACNQNAACAANVLGELGFWRGLSSGYVAYLKKADDLLANSLDAKIKKAVEYERKKNALDNELTGKPQE